MGTLYLSSYLTQVLGCWCKSILQQSPRAFMDVSNPPYMTRPPSSQPVCIGVMVCQDLPTGMLSALLSDINRLHLEYYHHNDVAIGFIPSPQSCHIETVEVIESVVQVSATEDISHAPNNGDTVSSPGRRSLASTLRPLPPGQQPIRTITRRSTITCYFLYYSRPTDYSILSHSFLHWLSDPHRTGTLPSAL